MHMAAASGHREVAKLLLARKADVNAKDNDGMTPLHMAVAWHHNDVAQLLLANKAEVNAKDNGSGIFRGRTPLHWAVAHGGHKDTQNCYWLAGPT